MNAFSTAVKFFQDCGLFIYLSILIMSLGLAIAIERFIFLNRARSENRRVWAEVKPMLEGGKFKEVQGVTAKSDAAIGRSSTTACCACRAPAVARTSTPRWRKG